MYVCYCPSGVKPEESLFRLLFNSVSFLRHLGGIPPGKHWIDRSNWSNVGRMWTCNSSVIFRLKNGFSRQIFLFESILGPASCPMFIYYWKMFGHFTAPESLLPVMWYTHILLVSSGTSWFSQKIGSHLWLELKQSQNNRACAYLSHCVILHSNFPKKEVDKVSIIDCLDKVGLCKQTKK